MTEADSTSPWHHPVNISVYTLVLLAAHWLFLFDVECTVFGACDFSCDHSLKCAGTLGLVWITISAVYFPVWFIGKKLVGLVKGD